MRIRCPTYGATTSVDPALNRQQNQLRTSKNRKKPLPDVCAFLTLIDQQLQEVRLQQLKEKHALTNVRQES